MLYLLSYAAMKRNEDGSPRRDRTAALLVNSQALYRLSYRGNERNRPAAHKRWSRWRRRSDSNRRGLAPTVLQTVAFDRLATSPRKAWMAGVHGIEPRTFGFGDRRSAN